MLEFWVRSIRPRVNRGLQVTLTCSLLVANASTREGGAGQGRGGCVGAEGGWAVSRVPIHLDWAPNTAQINKIYLKYLG